MCLAADKLQLLLGGTSMYLFIAQPRRFAISPLGPPRFVVREKARQASDASSI